MKEISVTELKAHCTQVVREVSDTPYMITKRGKPVAMIPPIKEGEKERPKTIDEYMGSLRGSVIEYGDIVERLVKTIGMPANEVSDRYARVDLDVGSSGKDSGEGSQCIKAGRASVWNQHDYPMGDR